MITALAAAAAQAATNTIPAAGSGGSAGQQVGHSGCVVSICACVFALHDAHSARYADIARGYHSPCVAAHARVVHSIFIVFLLRS